MKQRIRVPTLGSRKSGNLRPNISDMGLKIDYSVLSYSDDDSYAEVFISSETPLDAQKLGGEILPIGELDLISHGPSPSEPVRDLAAEIDELKAKVAKLEKK